MRSLPSIVALIAFSFNFWFMPLCYVSGDKEISEQRTLPINENQVVNRASLSSSDSQSSSWSNPDFQVVIGDDNRIKLEKRPPTTFSVESSANDDRHNSLQQYFTEHLDKSAEFESQRMVPERSNNSDPLNENAENTKADNTQNLNDLNQSSNTGVLYSTSLNNQSADVKKLIHKDHHHKYQIAPSFSKIPDYVAEQLMESDVGNNVHHSDPPQYDDDPVVENNLNKPLVVPIGSRVHTIEYKDFSNTESSKRIANFFDNSIDEDMPNDHYRKVSNEPTNRIIDIPDSRPVLPIVFNFRTHSSPLFATQTREKVINVKPKVQYLSTEEPAQIYQHEVHKPIYQDIHEIIIPYRWFLQEIAPVRDYRQTYIPATGNSVASNAYSGDYPLYMDHSHNAVRQTSNTDLAPLSSPIYANSDHTSTPMYNSDHSLASQYSTYSSMLHRNPYMDISYHIPYRIDDLYRRPTSYASPTYFNMNKFNLYN